MAFDASKVMDIEGMSSADFTVWRSAKQNEVMQVLIKITKLIDILDRYS